MILDTDNLKLKFFAGGHSIVDESWNRKNVFDAVSKIYYFVDGNSEISYEGKSITFLPGNMYLIPPGDDHSWFTSGQSSIIWIHFTLMLYESVNILDYHSFKRFYKPDRMHCEKIKKCIELFCQNDIYSQLLAKAYFLEIFSYFFRFQPLKKYHIEEKVLRLEPVIHYIEQHLSEKLTLQQLARIAAYEKTYFSTVFKDIYGVAPKHFILIKKIEKAKQLLITTSDTLECISESIGFHDVFHFSKTFKKLIGESPAYFRKKNLKLYF
jgi:AraC-like DNA-binding protein